MKVKGWTDFFFKIIFLFFCVHTEWKGKQIQVLIKMWKVVRLIVWKYMLNKLEFSLVENIFQYFLEKHIIVWPYFKSFMKSFCWAFYIFSTPSWNFFLFPFHKFHIISFIIRILTRNKYNSDDKSLLILFNCLTTCQQIEIKIYIKAYLIKFVYKNFLFYLFFFFQFSDSGVTDE